MRQLSAAVLLAAALALAACGPASTTDTLKKAEGIETKAGLEKALGKPSGVNKVGPIEQWTYKTSDGSVTFLITGDRVAISAGGTDRKN